MIKFSLIKKREGKPLQCVLWCSLVHYELIFVPTSWASARKREEEGVDKPWEVRHLVIVLVGLGGGFGQWRWLSYPRALSVLGTDQRSCSKQPPWAETPSRYGFNLHPLKLLIFIGIGWCILSFWCVEDDRVTILLFDPSYLYAYWLGRISCQFWTFDSFVLRPFSLGIKVLCSVSVCVGWGWGVGYCLMDYEGFGWS